MTTREKLYDEAMVRMHIPGLKLVDEAPATYKQLGRLMEVSAKAVRFHFGRACLWFPKRQVVQIRGKREFWATTWAIKTAMDYESRRHLLRKEER